MAWYAARVFYNRTEPLVNRFKKEGTRYYVPPRELISSLLFVDAEEGYVLQLAQEYFGKVMFYGSRESHCPTAIPDREMHVFMIVASSGEGGLLYLGDDKPEYRQGEHVRVIAGPFKGVEGFVRRIKKDRRVVVSLHGIVAVATTFIHPDLLERIGENEENR